MKIAMLSFRLPAPGEKRGGVERMAHDLADGLARRGHEVKVWSADPAPEGAAYEAAPVPGRRLIHNWLGFRLVSGYAGNLLALLPAYGDAQVIIAHGDSLLLPLRGIPVLRVMHGSAWDEARTAKSLFRKALQFGVYFQELATSATQRTVGVSRNTQARYRAIREVIPNGVPLSRFHPDAAAKSIAPAILFIGTLGGRKRGALLLEWFSDAIRPTLPDAELWMVSEAGPAIPGVAYFPGASEHQMADLCRRAWVLASPSTYEGFGRPYVESMASGTAVIATSNPGSREVLDDGRYGVLVEEDREFVPALLKLLRETDSRAHWAKRGPARARELSLDRMLDAYEAVLESLAAGHAKAEARA